MESLIGTGTVDACDTIGSGFQLAEQNPRGNVTIEVPTEKAAAKKLADTQTAHARML